MVELLVVLLVFVVVALVATILRAPGRGGRQERSAVLEGRPERALVRPRPLVPWIAGAATAATLVLWLGIYLTIAAAVGGVVGISTAILLRFLESRRLARFEFQLVDAIDLMVSTLRAGGGLTDALGGAARESGRPLRSWLNELMDRVRLGEEPEVVLANLEERVPLESFRLFTMTLSAHWQGGGSLASTLSNVGRTIRDRVDVTRRIRSQAVETQVSALAVLLVTYGLALLMYNNYPDRFELFATSELGAMFIGASILLQGVGLLWIAGMTRIRV